MQSYVTVRNRSYFEYEDRKSFFIGEAMPVESESDAIAFINSVKKHYPDAKHHVYAYVLRDNSIMRFSDDGEPQGTAGIPVLDVIRKNGCTDTVIVVTRYFGGTLLGTGGLVRAYTSAAAGALNSAQIITYDVYREYRLEVSYSDYQKLAPVFEECAFKVQSCAYSSSVELEGRVVSSYSEIFEKKLVEITSGRIKIAVLGEKFDY